MSPNKDCSAVMHCIKYNAENIYSFYFGVIFQRLFFFPTILLPYIFVLQLFNEYCFLKKPLDHLVIGVTDLIEKALTIFRLFSFFHLISEDMKVIHISINMHTHCF